MKLYAVVFFVAMLLGLAGLFRSEDGSMGELFATVFVGVNFLGFIVCLVVPEKKNKTIQMARKPKSRKGWSRW